MTATTLVTGGAGCIASHTVRALRRRGRSVVVLDPLGWSPRHDLESILESAYRWHVTQLAKA